MHAFIIRIAYAHEQISWSVRGLVGPDQFFFSVFWNHSTLHSIFPFADELNLEDIYRLTPLIKLFVDQLHTQ